MPGASSLITANELSAIPITLRKVAQDAANPSNSLEAIATSLRTLYPPGAQTFC
ncbi:hypothetical protein R3P38DRAFT_3180181 [Favolaschia claudopus]|uniref:Uncharacterized protein n=1 Tax=Favolaschia claudopus TaxID=2862362 RepID=A0AAW0CQL0_9AGAR